MSSISFPYGPGHSPSASTSSNNHDPQGYDYSTSSFENMSASSFTMNPLSSHPPRTPRTSIISQQNQVYGMDAYGGGGREENVDDQAVPPEDEVVIEDKATKEAASKVRKEEIWRDLLTSSTGRDKTLKIFQYSLKVYLLFHYTLSFSNVLRKQTRPPWEKELVNRLESTVSGFSLSRRCLILFEWLTPLTSVLANHPVPFSTGGAKSKAVAKKPLLHTLLHTPPPVLLDLVNGLADDIYTFSKLGLLGKKTGERAGRFADWCWFAGTLVALVENSVEMGITANLERDMEARLYQESMSGATAKSGSTAAAAKIDETGLQRLQHKNYWLHMTRLKLCMDLIFVCYDVFKLKRGKKPVQAFAGLAAAILSTMKLYDRHSNALIKKATA
ncbi:hypothetical protein JAAARDRAFT_28436 [Jaapia argillacea MUCL 33604]|uniref:Uncharacterized protein n=1 Tax=Jaapia argillacea MUCL 33604 TaxID=933084 RepID=A0A067QCU1_9AGAM|nr:hypothetical protein JAAARDRAFT_28436 [Jaapia argillacea MUCL 33604]